MTLFTATLLSALLLLLIGGVLIWNGEKVSAIARELPPVQAIHRSGFRTGRRLVSLEGFQPGGKLISETTARYY